MVDLYSPKSELDQRCRLASTADVTFTIDTDIEAAYILNLNGNYYHVFPMSPATMVMDSGAQLVTLGETATITPYWVEAMIINEIGMTDGEDLGLRLQGGVNGCIGDIFHYVRQDPIEANLLHVEAFRLHRQTQDCPENFVPSEITVDTRTPAENTPLVSINGDLYQPTPGKGMLTMQRQWVTIEAVNILPSPDGFSVYIAATQNGDCGKDVEVVQDSAPYGSIIGLHVTVPENTPCTRNLIPFETSRSVRTMPVIVNGTLYDVAESNADGGDDKEMSRIQTVIETVEVNVLESFPMQLDLVITGYQPDGCDFPVEVEQTIDGNRVSVAVYRNIPVDTMCPMNIVPYNETIRIDGSFTGGTIRINVNSFFTSINLE